MLFSYLAALCSMQIRDPLPVCSAAVFPCRAFRFTSIKHQKAVVQTVPLGLFVCIVYVVVFASVSNASHMFKHMYQI